MTDEVHKSRLLFFHFDCNYVLLYNNNIRPKVLSQFLFNICNSSKVVCIKTGERKKEEEKVSIYKIFVPRGEKKKKKKKRKKEKKFLGLILCREDTYFTPASSKIPTHQLPSTQAEEPTTPTSHQSLTSPPHSETQSASRFARNTTYNHPHPKKSTAARKRH